MMLKLALIRDEGCVHPITLEDLLVITNISDPKGGKHYPEENQIVYLFGKNTLFTKIEKVKDKSDQVITKKIRQVFRWLIQLKIESLPNTSNPDKQGVHRYYHTPDTLTYGDYVS